MERESKNEKEIVVGEAYCSWRCLMKGISKEESNSRFRFICCERMVVMRFQRALFIFDMFWGHNCCQS